MRKKQIFLPVLLRKARQRRDVTYDVIDELRRFSLSKCFSALCHKLIYEIAIFHSINGETCDKYFFITVLLEPSKMRVLSHRPPPSTVQTLIKIANK